MVGHVAPEAAVGGPIGLIADGDLITLDVPSRRLDVHADLSGRTQASRPRRLRGALAKYAALVSSASRGAVTAFPSLSGALRAAAPSPPVGLRRPDSLSGRAK